MKYDGTYLKPMNYKKEGEGGVLRNYFSEQVEYIYDCTIRERTKTVQDILKRDSIYVKGSKNIKKRSNTSILTRI